MSKKIGRPYKRNLEFWRYDCGLGNDPRIQFLNAKFNGYGHTVYTQLADMAYRENGYFLRYDEDVLFTESRIWNIDFDLVKQIIEAALKKGLFDEEMFNRHRILTSRRMQAHFVFGCQNCDVLAMNKEYLLIDPSLEMTEKQKKNQRLVLEFLNGSTPITIFPDQNRLSPEESRVSPKERPLSSDLTPITKQNKTKQNEIIRNDNKDKSSSSSFKNNSFEEQPSKRLSADRQRYLVNLFEQYSEMLMLDERTPHKDRPKNIDAYAGGMMKLFLEGKVNTERIEKQVAEWRDYSRDQENLNLRREEFHKKLQMARLREKEIDQFLNRYLNLDEFEALKKIAEKEWIRQGNSGKAIWKNENEGFYVHALEALTKFEEANYAHTNH